MDENEDEEKDQAGKLWTHWETHRTKGKIDLGGPQ